jgi:DNA modification methylase
MSGPTVRLIFGDCLEVMRGMEAGSIDAVVTDPPYGIGFRYTNGRETAADPASYWEWLRPRHAGWMRCLKPGGLMAIWQTQLHFRHLWGWFGDDIHVYAACKNFVQLRKTPINYAYDPVVMAYKPGHAPRRPARPARNVDYFVGDSRPSPRSCSAIERAHPCPRPLDQVAEIVANFVAEGGTVLDPFMGSGTTGVACLRAGRNFIGIEIEPDYFAIAERRLAAERARMPLLGLAD